MTGSSTDNTREHVDVLVVGAGLAGLYILHCLRQRGLTVRAFEAGSGVGGTWYWNRYPGARVDVESMQYCYHFSDELAREWKWTEKFSAQPELLRYINHVADRFELRRDVKFDTRVTSASFNDDSNLWTLRTDQGDIATGQYCIVATGSLSKPYRAPFPAWTISAVIGTTPRCGHTRKSTSAANGSVSSARDQQAFKQFRSLPHRRSI